MVKRVFIIHGWDFNPEMHWYPWLKEELESNGFEVIVSEMPNTSEPDIVEWTEHLGEVVGKIREDDLFIGHSIGGQTIMRYLQDQPENTKIGGCIIVAGWIKLDNLEDESVEDIARPWLEKPINFEKIKNFTSNWMVFISDNDPYNCIEENQSIFKDRLGAKVSIIEGAGHFTQDDGITELPEVLDELLSIAGQ